MIDLRYQQSALRAAPLLGQPDALVGTRAPALDCNAILRVVGGNMALLHEIIDIFLAEQGGALAEIESAIQAGNSNQLRLAAHALHGTAGNFRHRPACAAAGALEQMGRAGDLTGAAEAFAVLTGAVADLAEGLIELKTATAC